jgi:carbon-monoxide dehydrogenase small subunit
MLINLIVNGVSRSAQAAPAMPAVHFLRDLLGLKSVKEGCGIGECGACSIIVNGQAVDSCLMPAAKLDGAEVVTAEGLASPEGTPHPLQEAFVRHNAVQCGYCSPGFLMSAKAFLDENPDPSRKEVEKALAGNICRCTGYQQIIDAVLDAAQAAQAAQAARKPL